MESVSKKLVLIIVAIVVSVFLVFMFAFQGVQNKAISFEEQITTSQSEIEIQEKRRADLIPNLVDCVKQYDQHEYETLMAVVEARGVNSDDAVEEIQTMVAAVAEAYPQLQSSANYQQLMTELATTENLIANVRSNYHNAEQNFPFGDFSAVVSIVTVTHCISLSFTRKYSLARLPTHRKSSSESQ